MKVRAPVRFVRHHCRLIQQLHRPADQLRAGEAMRIGAPLEELDAPAGRLLRDDRLDERRRRDGVRAI